MNRKQSFNVLWLIAGIAGLFTWLWGVSLPYVGIYNANNNYLALAAKNFLKFGFESLHFLPTYIVASDLPQSVLYYLHHPVLFFWLETIPFALFGNGNWVVHLVPFLFALGSIVVLYRIVLEISDKSTARWTALFALLFPMTSFFWKYMMFEQASLFFTLLCLLFFLKRNLVGLFFAAALGGATDWYGIYLLFGLSYLYIAQKGNRAAMRSGIVVFLLGAMLGLSTYVVALVGSGNIFAAYEGFLGRGITNEITVLSWWPVRLFLVTLIRIVIYFSPLLLLSLTTKIKNKGIHMFFLIIGLVNLVALPAASWGHSYFLYYFVPFAAYTMGSWVSNNSHRGTLFVWGVVLFQIVWSVSVSSLKITQVTKQSWKYDFGRDIQKVVPPYTHVGVIAFPGDVLEYYFDVPTTTFSRVEMERWAIGVAYKDIPHVIMTCQNICTGEEMSLLNLVRDHRGIQEFRYGDKIGWIAGGTPVERPIKMTRKERVRRPNQVNESVSVPLRFYRMIRDFLGSTQI